MSWVSRIQSACREGEVRAGRKQRERRGDGGERKDPGGEGKE